MPDHLEGSERLARRGVCRPVAVAALAAVLVLAATPVGAGSPGRTFRAEPTTIGLGQAATLTATDCTAPGLAADDLAVLIHIGSDRSTSTWGQVTPDDEGTAVFVTPVVEPSSLPGPYELGASCVDVSGEAPETLFSYGERVVITVVTDAGPAGPATPAPSAPGEPSPARPAIAVPRLTG